MMNRYLLTSGLLALILLGFKITSELSKNPTPETDDYVTGNSTRQNRTKVAKYSKNTARTPASQARGSKINHGPSYVESQKNDDLFQNKIDEPTSSGSMLGYSGGPAIPTPTYRGSSAAETRSNSKTTTSATKPLPGGGFAGTPFPVSRPPLAQAVPVPPAPKPEAAPRESISCSANLGTGAFSSPQVVTLSCTSSSEIRYCISENTCCDPDSGPVYSAPINVGTTSGTYCLSFQGSSNSSSATSSINEISYTFNAELPDLQVAHPKIVYQTTELRGQLNITSDDFGTANHSMGVINLVDHDPGVAGLNWSCSDILNQYTTLNSGTPTVPMVRTDIAAIPNSSQIDVFLNNLNLSYGKNYVTSFVSNDTFMNAFVSCSSTLVTLEDFEYFESASNQAEVGTNDVREFSGGFTHLGFFEPEATVYRGPAGLGSENVATQELKSGMFGVFY